MALRFTYSRWDGTQKGFDLDADALMDALKDELLYHGDVNSALRRLMQNGMKADNGERLQGLRDMLEQIRKKRQETLENHNLGGVYDDIANELREILDAERQNLDKLAEEARQSPDQRRQETGPRPPRSASSSSTCCRPIWPDRFATCRTTTSRRPMLNSVSRSCCRSCASS